MIMNELICGLIWSVMWSVYVFLILKCYPFSMLHDYPKDIQAAAAIDKPTKEQEKAAKRFGAVAVLYTWYSACIRIAALQHRTGLFPTGI